MFVVVLVAVIMLVVIFLRRRYSYWSRRGVTQAPPVPLAGNLLDVLLHKSSAAHIYHEIYRKYSDHDAVGVYGFLTPKLLLINPELVKRVMVSDFTSFHDNEFYVTKQLDPLFHEDPFILRGNDWKAARSALVSVLTPWKVKEMFVHMKQQIPQLDSFLRDNCGRDIEAKYFATLFTMDNVSNSVFGITSNCYTDPEAEFRKMADIVMKEQLQGWKSMILDNFQTLRDILGYRVIPSKVHDFLENLVVQIVQYRKENNIKRNDVVQYLMSKDKTGGGNISEITNHGATFFLEGFETSSIVMSFALYELAMNPEIQQTLYEEIQDTMNESLELDYEILMNLKYVDSVIEESMRKYGVVYLLKRICTQQCNLNIDGNTVKIEPNTPVLIPSFSIHHDSRHFPDPDVFDPERFSDINKASRHQYTSLPFGEGPRICPGIRFAKAQIKLALANIVYKYKILRSEKTPQTITLKKDAFLLISETPLFIKFERRDLH